jgi:TIR domain
VATIAKDVFICHVSEGKQEVAQPLYQAFQDSNISSWYDKAEIRWGDSSPKKINQDMRTSTYVMRGKKGSGVLLDCLVLLGRT